MKCRTYLLGLLFVVFAIIYPTQTVSAEETDFLEMLTKEERSYIEELDVIPVIISKNKGPIQYVDAHGELKGITLDILEKISEISNITFKYVSFNTMQDIKESIDSGQAQIVGGIPGEQAVKEAYMVDFTKSYLDCSYGVVLNRNTSIDDMEELTLALTYGLDIPEHFLDVKAVKRYQSIQECINAVQRKEADFTYGNAYVLEFYSQGYLLQNLCVIPSSGKNQNICFGISKDTSGHLKSILDKAIDYIGEDGMSKIVVKNVAVSTQPITLSALISANPQVSIVFGAVIILIIAFAAVLLIGNYHHKNKLIYLEHQKFLLVSEVANEYFYEYNYKMDTMILAEDTAELFGCKRITHKWLSRIQQKNAFLNLDKKQISELYEIISVSNDGTKSSGNRTLELQLPLKSGDLHWFSITRAAIYESSRLAYIVGKMKDVQEEHQEMESLMEKSLCDSITGIYNTISAKEFISQALKKQRDGTLFIMDLDFFKTVNDKFGHQMGDKVIKGIADILKKAFRDEDIIGRIGGDEFIAFAVGISDTEFIKMKCEYLQEKAKQIQIADGYHQTISIGVAKVTQNTTYELLYQQADAALYFVKENGRSNFHIANE